MKFCNKFARNKGDYKNIKEKTDVIVDAYRLLESAREIKYARENKKSSIL
jgi:hypothetical protein